MPCENYFGMFNYIACIFSHIVCMRTHVYVCVYVFTYIVCIWIQLYSIYVCMYIQLQSMHVGPTVCIYVKRKCVTVENPTPWPPSPSI